MKRVSGLLLAAGAGRRMGLPKALLHATDGEPLLARTAARMVEGGCDEVVVVLGCAAEEADALLAANRSRWPTAAVRSVVAEHWDTGMAASLGTGLQAVIEVEPAAQAVLIHLVDLPDVPAAAVARVIDAWQASGTSPAALLRASYDGGPGHPVLLGRDQAVALAVEVATALAEGDRADYGARHYLANRRVHLVDCADLATGRDVDRPDDLERT